MTRISFWQPAGAHDVPGKGEFPQKFAPGAWDRQVGKQVPMKGPGGEDMGLVTLVAAEVDADGGGVTLMIEVPDDFPPGHAIPMQRMSFRFLEPEPLPLETAPLEAVRPRITWKP